PRPSVVCRRKSLVSSCQSKKLSDEFGKAQLCRQNVRWSVAFIVTRHGVRRKSPQIVEQGRVKASGGQPPEGPAVGLMGAEEPPDALRLGLEGGERLLDELAGESLGFELGTDR